MIVLDASAALELLLRAPDHPRLVANCTAYGVAYLALWESLDAPLITCDTKLALIPAACASVKVIGE